MSLSSGKITAYAVLLAAVLALLAPVVVIERNVLQHTEGTFVLPKDGSFINIAVAKNLAFHGVWGLSKHSFQPVSSSLLYPVLFAPVFFIAGAHLVIPLVINSLAAIFLLWLVQQYLIRRRVSPLVQLTILLLVIFLPPLPFLILSGTEYPVFLLLVVLFATSFERAMSTGSVPGSVLVYGALLVATRYEGLLLIALACLLLLRSGQDKQVLRLASIAVAPVLVFGLISVWKGHAFIPLPLLQPSAEYIAGWVGAVLVILILELPLPIRRQSLTCSLVAVFALLRCVSVLGAIAGTSISTYTWEVQAARFVHRYYNRWGVGLEEMGAAAYFSEGRKVDLREHFRSSWMADSSIKREGARLAILWGNRSDSGWISHWSKVASWHEPGDIVSFYAADTSLGRRLNQNLREFEPFLPAGIQASYY